MSADFGSDPWLDARLRNVPLPVGLTSRLKQIQDVTDDQLDALICDVPLPPGLLERLGSLSQIPERRIAWHAAAIPWRQMALAASLMVAVGVFYVVIMGSFLATTFPPARETPQMARHTPGDSLEDDAAAKVDLAQANPAQPAVTPAEASNASTPAVASRPDDAVSETPAEIGLDALVETPALQPAPGSEFQPRVRPQSVFTAQGGFDNLPELEVVRAPQSPGFVPPLVPGYDLVALLKTGEHPFVVPQSHATLASVDVPLGGRSDGYRRAVEAVRRGHLPPADDLRSEDFVAAWQDLFPPAAEGTLAIRTAAGPAPLGELGLRLLEVGAQAGQVRPGQRQPTELTVAIDTSASMRQQGRLQTVRRALARLSNQLAPGDRLTLVGYSDRAELLVDSVDRASSDRLRSALDNLRPAHATNVGAGIELACATARRPAAGKTRRLVLLTDGVADPGAVAMAEISSLLRATADEGIGMTVIDASGDFEIDSQLTLLTDAGRGNCVRAADEDTIGWALVEALSGSSQLVGRNVHLKVTFNPKVVQAYRLLGHAPTTLTQSAVAASEIDLHGGQSAAGLFEVWLKSEGGDDVATAELRWLDAADGQPRQLTQRVSRLQFAKSFAEAPLSLQAALLAAETARALRTPGPAATRNLARIAELAGSVAPPLRTHESLVELVALVRAAERLRQSGSPTRRDR